MSGIDDFFEEQKPKKRFWWCAKKGVESFTVIGSTEAIARDKARKIAGSGVRVHEIKNPVQVFSPEERRMKGNWEYE